MSTELPKERTLTYEERNELSWAKERPGFDLRPYIKKVKKTYPKYPYWINTAWKVECPDCHQRVDLCVKRGGRKFYYQYHSLKGTSGAVNPMFYVINIVGCKRSHTPYDDFLPLSESEHDLKGVIIRRLTVAQYEDQSDAVAQFAKKTIEWLRSPEME